jgi:hypothetical protein
MLAGEHALCETDRPAKGDSSGNDAFHKDQDFVWISEYRADESIITEVHRGNKPVYRTEDHDRRAFEELPRHDSNPVRHQWWIPRPDRTSCLVHFVNECISNGSDPLEIMFSSKKGRKNSSNEEKLSIWRSYITKASNKIDINKLPESVRYLHSKPLSVEIVNTKGTVTQIKESARLTKSRNNKVSGEKRLAKAVAAVVEQDSNKRSKKGLCTNVTNGTHHSPGMIKFLGDYFVHLDLWGSARRAWEERYGKELPAINAFGNSYKTVGTIWTQSIAVRENEPWCTTTHYPPSVLDDYAINLPNDDGVGFRNQKSAVRALLWRIICTVPLIRSRRRWAEQLLGEHMSALLIVSQSQPWCRLSRDEDGSFWVEYNGRKLVLT